MKIKRVLTIESIDDATTRRMLKLIYGSSELKDYGIDHFFFLEGNRTNIDKEELYNKLNKKIIDFEPHAILIHTGISLYDNMSTFIEVIPTLKNKYPFILFGIQHRKKANDKILAIVDNNNEIQKLETLFFTIER